MDDKDGAPSRATDALVAAFEGLGSSVVCDAFDRLGLPSALLDPGVARMAGSTLLGRARTVDRIPRPSNASQTDYSEELGTGTQKVIDSCEPGSVIVIAARGDLSSAMVGGNLCNRARIRGSVGVVTDGAIRDRDELADMGLTVFARATSSRQAVGRMLTVSIDEPVVCGGVLIRPGDIILGDADGVVVIPQSHAEEVSAQARELERLEALVAEHLDNGNTLVDAIAKYKVR
jgi:4-hydroxy-4-methyl-2-oxoglutarate aldolase